MPSQSEGRPGGGGRFELAAIGLEAGDQAVDQIGRAEMRNIRDGGGDIHRVIGAVHHAEPEIIDEEQFHGGSSPVQSPDGTPVSRFRQQVASRRARGLLGREP